MNVSLAVVKIGQICLLEGFIRMNDLFSPVNGVKEPFFGIQEEMSILYLNAGNAADFKNPFNTFVRPDAN